VTKRGALILIAVAVPAIAAAAWYGFLAGGSVSGIDVANTELTARGKAVYAQECAACHGRNLEGQVPNWRQRLADGSLPAPPHDSTGHTWHHPDGILFEVTKYGRLKAAGPRIASTMPAFGEKLSDRDIWAVLSYIKSRWPAQIRQRHDSLNERYRASR